MRRGRTGKLRAFARKTLFTLFVDLAFTNSVREAFTNAFDASRECSVIPCL
jgi:hypothetical protein